MPYRKALYLLFAIMCFIPSVAWAQGKIVGDWQGLIDVDGTKLHLVLHIRQAANGELSALIDSIDQNRNVRVKAVEFDGVAVNLNIESIDGTYAGVLSKNGKELKGVWNEGGSLALTFKKVPDSVKLVQPVAIGGDWEGSINQDGVERRIRLHINTTSCTAIMGTFNGPNWIPELTEWFVITFKNDSLRFMVKSSSATYSGALQADKSQFNGVWKEGHTFPLNLHRVLPPYEGYERPKGCLGPAS